MDRLEMTYRRLGRTGLDVSRVSLGTGGPNRMGQKRGAPKEDMIALVHRALELGINLYDTSPRYMDSEVILGEALRSTPREGYVLATKFHALYEGPVPDDVELIDSVERSLRRLGTDHVDVLFLHSVAPDRYEAATERLVPAMVRLRDRGLVRFLGVTEAPGLDPTHVSLGRAVTDGRFDVIMAIYNLLNQTAEQRLFPAAADADVGVIGMMAVGRQLGGYEGSRAVLEQWASRGLIDSAVASSGLEWVASGPVRSLADACYRFAAEPAAVASVLTGTAQLGHLADNAASILGPPLPGPHAARLRGLFGGIAEPVAG